MKKYISNSFSLQMLPQDGEYHINTKRIDPSQLGDLEGLEGLESCIGHKDLCNLVNQLTGRQFAPCRKSITLEQGDKLIVAQYSGERLPEGATRLPEGASIIFILVEIERRC